MNFVETPIQGVVVIELEPLRDERGMFARSFSADEFGERGLLDQVVEANVSHNTQVGTLRGMHYQAAPYPDPKIMRCTSGAVYDVAVDLRAGSGTYCRWFGTVLAASEGTALHVPAGCAHGYLTLDPGTTVAYLMGERYHSELSQGVRWDDPTFGIEWPFEPSVISARDAAFPDHDVSTSVDRG